MKNDEKVGREIQPGLYYDYESLAAPVAPGPGSAVRGSEYIFVESPAPSVCLLTHDRVIGVQCSMNRHDPMRPFPVLYIGKNFSLQPSIEQLVALRDEITEFLERETSTRTSHPDLAAQPPFNTTKEPA